VPDLHERRAGRLGAGGEPLGRRFSAPPGSPLQIAALPTDTQFRSRLASSPPVSEARGAQWRPEFVVESEWHGPSPLQAAASCFPVITRARALFLLGSAIRPYKPIPAGRIFPKEISVPDAAPRRRHTCGVTSGS